MNDAQILSQLVVTYRQTTAEVTAGVVPTNYYYPEFNILRYGGDPTGTNDSTQAFNNLFAVLINSGGGVGYLYPGKYKVSSTLQLNLTPNSGPNTETSGFTLAGYGANIEYSGSGYCISLHDPNTAATYYHPQVKISGLNITGTSSGSGGVILQDIGGAVLEDMAVFGFSNGAAYTLQNTTAWCENDRLIGCLAINCEDGLAFSINGSSFNSFARTHVQHFFTAGITRYVVNVGGGTGVYDSKFYHITGNFGGVAYFSIGASGNDADMTGTVISDLDCELTGTQSGQGVFRLQNYPNASGTFRRPIVINVSLNTTFTGSGNIPLWTNGSGTTEPGPESAQTQYFGVEGPIASACAPNEALNLASPGSTQSIYIKYVIGGTTVAYEGVAGANGGLITGSLAGDFCLAPNGNLRISLNQGASIAASFLSSNSGLQMTGPIGENGNSPPSQSTGWGTPTGASVQNNFSGSSATLAETSAAVAEIITYLKSKGCFGA